MSADVRNGDGVPVSLRGLAKRFGSVEALKPLDLDIAAGELVAFLGPSGCGKTTTLLLIAGIYKADEGEVWFADRRVDGLHPRDRDVGMVFQSYALYPHLTLFENIAYPLRLKRLPDAEVKRRVEQIAEVLGIAEQLGRRPSQVSGGQQQRAAIARAQVKEPSVMLLDEPLSNLDAQIRLQARGEIRRLQKELGVNQIRFPETSGIGVKPVSVDGTKRLVRKAIQYAIDNDRSSVTLVHKGNIMKFTEGGFRDWGYELAREEFGAELIDGGPWCKFKNPKTGREITVKDSIADAFLQQILLRPAEYDVIATLNLNGDYVSDALAAQVGGIGIAPGANLSDSVAMFEATHGTAPKYAGKDYVNPGSLILSAEMMLRHLGWTEAADLIIASMEKAILSKKVTYDFARLMEGANQVSCSGFGQVMIENM